MTELLDPNDPRVKEFFEYLIRMTGGELQLQAPISDSRDTFDAIIHSVNVLVGELAHAKAQAEAASRNKSAFLAKLSHEIRTPLSIIIGNLEIYDSKLPEVTREKIVKRMSASADYSLQLVNQILDLARAESDTLALDKKTFQVEDELRAIVDAFQMQTQKKAIKLLFEISPSASLSVHTDLQKVRQVVLNLLSNAIRHTSEGQVKIRAEKKDYAGLQNALCIDVSDTGSGIPEQKRVEIFEAFKQIDPASAKAKSGLGLGLAISKQLSKFLGGDLILLTSSERGSQFCFFIPVSWCENAVSMQNSDARQILPSKPLLGIRILLGEDHDDLRELTTYMLESAGAQVDAAGSGEDISTLASKNTFDIAVLDIQMPDCSGDQVLRGLREDGFRAPAIALTAFASKNDLNRFLNQGFCHCLSKPASQEQLISAILNCLNS